MTIRLRLTLWYTALLGTTLILFSVVVYSALATNLWAQAEQDAERQAHEVADALRQQLQGELLIFRIEDFPEQDLFVSASGVQLVGLDGMILKRSTNLGASIVPGFRNALDPVRHGENDVYYTASENGTNLLVYTVPLVMDDLVVGAVQVIKTVITVENALSQVRRYLVLGTALCLVLAAIVGAFLARSALTPIDTITDTASQITRTKDLGQRIAITEESSEVGRLAATFNAMLDHIQQLFDTQQRLVADVSHELRTPLTTIQGNVELLQRMATSNGNKQTGDVSTELLCEVLDEVEDEASRMNTLISDLLLIAQADSGALQIERKSVEMDTLVLDIYRQARKIADRKKGPGGLEIRLGSEDQALVYGDHERLRQLLINLVDNAIKYTPAGGIITIGLKNIDDWVQVYVSDTGIGISEEDQQFIFDRFYRVDKARSREMGGSGLGLSIVQWIAEAHHGHLSVESEQNGGSTFTLWLPRQEA